MYLIVSLYYSFGKYYLIYSNVYSLILFLQMAFLLFFQKQQNILNNGIDSCSSLSSISTLSLLVCCCIRSLSRYADCSLNNINLKTSMAFLKVSCDWELVTRIICIRIDSTIRRGPPSMNQRLIPNLSLDVSLGFSSYSTFFTLAILSFSY